MKTKLIFIIGVISLSMWSCEKFDLLIDVPDCMAEEIKSFSKSDEGCKGASVVQYLQIDRYVYLFIPGDCKNDRLIKLYDSECKVNCTWDISDNYWGVCSMSPFALINRDDGVLVWENK